MRMCASGGVFQAKFVGIGMSFIDGPSIHYTMDDGLEQLYIGNVGRYITRLEKKTHNEGNFIIYDIGRQ